LLEDGKINGKNFRAVVKLTLGATKAWQISLYFCFLQEGFVRAEWLEVGRSNTDPEIAFYTMHLL